jgi:hypothetical protein
MESPCTPPDRSTRTSGETTLDAAREVEPGIVDLPNQLRVDREQE